MFYFEFLFKLQCIYQLIILIIIMKLSITFDKQNIYLANMNIHTGLMAVLQAVIYIIIPTPTSVGYAYVICHRLDTM